MGGDVGDADSVDAATAIGREAIKGGVGGAARWPQAPLTLAAGPIYVSGLRRTRQGRLHALWPLRSPSGRVKVRRALRPLITGKIKSDHYCSI
jgi:hypothetical protein